MLLSHFAGVEVRLLPALAGLAGGVAPFLGGLLRGGHDLADLRRRAEERLVPLRGLGDVELDDLAVVGHQAVHLHLHVGGLRVDRGRESLADQRVQPAHERVVAVAQFLGGLEGAVAPVVAVLPEVPLERQAQPAELAEHADAIGHHREHAGAGVVVHVLHVAEAAVGPAARAVDEPRRVVLLHPLQDVVGVVLAPPLVERHPDDDAREEPQVVDHRLEFRAELLASRGGERRVLLRVRADELPAARHAAAGHVLPDEQAELVAVVVVARRLDLDVLAEHVDAELLEHFEVVLHRLVGRRREQPVRPPALIERPDLEERLVVEHEPHDAVLVLRGADLADGEVDSSRRSTGLARSGTSVTTTVVEVRRIGGPELARSRNFQRIRPTGLAGVVTRTLPSDRF